MSTSSSEEGPWLASYRASSSGLESTTSILFSAPSDFSDVQTEIAPPNSPTAPEVKMRTPKDILDTSRQLGRISLGLGEKDITPTRPLRQVNHRALTQSVVANDEAGYDADADGGAERDGNGSRNRSAREVADTAASRPLRRPTFLRVDTRQHRRVASMLATRRPASPSFCDAEVPRRAHRELPSLGLLQPTTGTAGAGKKTDKMESYELRRRPRAEPVGLGIGFPENHPLRNRAFSMPIPVSASPVFDSELEEEKRQEQRLEWVPSASLSKSKKPAQVAVYSPGPARVSLRPTLLEVAPSPMENLPAQASGVVASRRDDAYDRSGRERRCARTLKGRVDLVPS